ncbi:hypothetical protein [Burkholderia ubonensis]|nr:hypothetical protein [Burkholderia ubonensis]
MKIKHFLSICLSSCVIVGMSSCDNGGSKNQSDATASSVTEASAASEANWPKSVTVKLTQTPEEKRFLNDARCFDDACFTAEKFDRFIAKKYPDIAKIHFRVSEDFGGDKDAIATARMDFRRGLYFAKQIRLADGESLFDLLSKCSRSFDPNNVAQLAFDPKTDKPFIFMQFFPVFLQKGSGKNIDLNLLWDRVGDELRARSPFFSTNVLVNSDFLAMHGIECRSTDAPATADE